MLMVKSSRIPKLEAPLAAVFKIARMNLLFMPLSCDDLFRSLLQSEIPFAVARWALPGGGRRAKGEKLRRE